MRNILPPADLAGTMDPFLYIVVSPFAYIVVDHRATLTLLLVLLTCKVLLKYEHSFFFTVACTASRYLLNCHGQAEFGVLVLYVVRNDLLNINNVVHEIYDLIYKPPITFPIQIEIPL